MMRKSHAVDSGSAAKGGGHGIVTASRHSLVLMSGRATLILVFVAVVTSFFVTVTHEDVLHYIGRKNAILLSNPEPGALYAVDDQQIFGNYLCGCET